MPRNVEKLRVPVRLAAIGREPMEGHLSLSPHAETHDGPETLCERLNALTRVVPFQRADDDAVLLVTIAHIEWVVAGPQVASQLVRPSHVRHAREDHVRVCLVGGACHEGILAIGTPHGFNRVSDFLNGAEDFFPLQTPLGTMLVNKGRVLDVRVRNAGAMPRAA